MLFRSSLTFEAPDKETFRCLQLAYDAMHIGGTAPCVMNAANEVAVQAFLEDRIGFLEIPHLIEGMMNSMEVIQQPTLEDFIELDRATRAKALETIS